MGHAQHTWPSVFGWGLSLSGCALAFFGSVGLFLPHPALHWLAAVSFASLMAFAIACANVAADVAVRALRRRVIAWDAAILGGMTCVGFAIAANIGVHLGWELLIQKVATGVTLPEGWKADLAFYILCAGKPLIAALISYLNLFGEEDAAAAKERRDAHHLAMTQAARQPVEAGVAEAAREARLAAAGVPDIAPRGAARLASERPTEAETIVAARALIARGITPSNRTMAAELKLPRSRIERGPQAWRSLLASPQRDLLSAATGG